jgi:hypothetical protein
VLWKFAVFADGVLLLSLVVSVTRWLESRSRVTCGGRTEGTVTGYRRHPGPSVPGTWTPATLVCAIVSYRDRVGREHTTEVVGDLPVGETISVLFNRTNRTRRLRSHAVGPSPTW